jgi:hypothetical protein
MSLEWISAIIFILGIIIPFCIIYSHSKIYDRENYCSNESNVKDYNAKLLEFIQKETWNNGYATGKREQYDNIIEIINGCESDELGRIILSKRMLIDNITYNFFE